jgi:predicted transcriptional regulator
MIPKQLVTPKSRVTTLFSDMTIRQAIERMNKSRFQMVPVLEKDSGRYLYSLAASDILKHIVTAGSYEKSLDNPISRIPIDRLIIPATNDISMEMLVDLLANQNYVPIVDNGGIFGGIITRKNDLYHLIKTEEEEENA